MDIGKLRDRVTIQKRTVGQKDGAGGHATTYPDTKKIWAQRLVPSFRQQVIQGGVQSMEQVQARIRKHSGLLIGDHIQWSDGTVYDVLAVDGTDPAYDIVALRVIKKRGA